MTTNGTGLTLIKGGMPDLDLRIEDLLRGMEPALDRYALSARVVPPLPRAVAASAVESVMFALVGRGASLVLTPRAGARLEEHAVRFTDAVRDVAWKRPRIMAFGRFWDERLEPIRRAFTVAVREAAGDALSVPEVGRQAVPRALVPEDAAYAAIARINRGVVVPRAIVLPPDAVSRMPGVLWVERLPAPFPRLIPVLRFLSRIRP
jgi:hypothetical protein